MQVVLFGQKWLAAEVLKALIAMDGVEVIAVCPDEKAGILLETTALLGIPCVGVDDIPHATLGIAAHCQRFIKKEARERFSMGVLAYHPSLLPRHRGGDAVYWTIAMKDCVAGGTVYWMNDGADTGKIEAQDWCHVPRDDTPQSLWRRDLAPMGKRLLLETVDRLAKGDAPRAIPQDEKVTTWEPIIKIPKLSEGGRKEVR